MTSSVHQFLTTDISVVDLIAAHPLLHMGAHPLILLHLCHLIGTLH